MLTLAVNVMCDTKHQNNSTCSQRLSHCQNLLAAVCIFFSQQQFFRSKPLGMATQKCQQLDHHAWHPPSLGNLFPFWHLEPLVTKKQFCVQFILRPLTEHQSVLLGSSNQELGIALGRLTCVLMHWPKKGTKLHQDFCIF